MEVLLERSMNNVYAIVRAVNEYRSVCNKVARKINMKGYYEHTSTSLAKGQASPICHLLSFRIPPLIIGLSPYDVSPKLPKGPQKGLQ